MRIHHLIFFISIIFIACSDDEKIELDEPINPVETFIPLGQDSSMWELVWHDEFDYENDSLENNWISQNGSWGGVVLCSRWRENAEVHDGILELKAKKENRADKTGPAETFGQRKLSAMVISNVNTNMPELPGRTIHFGYGHIMVCLLTKKHLNWTLMKGITLTS